MPGFKDCISMEDSKSFKKVSDSSLKELCELVLYLQLDFSIYWNTTKNNCILAVQSDTHSVCICTIHQNGKWMIDNSKMNGFTDGKIKIYDCLLKVICNMQDKNE